MWFAHMHIHTARSRVRTAVTIKFCSQASTIFLKVLLLLFPTNAQAMQLLEVIIIGDFHRRNNFSSSMSCLIVPAFPGSALWSLSIFASSAVTV